ncbi:HAD-like domain-containing protein [Gaertneriomyces semiglobifer]|nr:HAD-like domain-containing protein [Gaertneriomyces semiglobifer]
MNGVEAWGDGKGNGEREEQSSCGELISSTSCNRRRLDIVAGDIHEVIESTTVISEGNVTEETIELTISWSGNTYPISVPQSSTIRHLKENIAALTDVRPERQKLLGLVKGKVPADDIVLRTLQLGKGVVRMMGTVEHKIFQEPSPEERPEVVNDLDADQEDYMPGDEAKNDIAHCRLLKETIEKTTISLINPLRQGKKLVVLDLDYTLFDCKSSASHISLLARPGMHEFLTALYPYYDICIWSQTAWRWLEMKITELGIITHPAYKIAFVLDKSSMFTITSARRTRSEVLGGRRVQRPLKHQVKPLELIWTKLSESGLGPHNTIHVDDVGRNFAMNPQSGLKISAFKNGPQNRQDSVLFHVLHYLLRLVYVDDFTALDHNRWKYHEGPIPSDVPDTTEAATWGVWGR